MRPLHLLAVAVLTFVVAQPAAAQTDWMGKLRNTLGTVTPPGGSSSGGALSLTDITAGLREALKVGSERVVGQIGSADGYNLDPDIHIPLPPELQKVQSVLKRFGLSGMADDLELRLNRAAEAAAPKTKELIWKAITEMTLEDAKQIYDGPDDAATQYFKKVASADLADTVRPVVDRSLEEVGAVSSYDSLMGQYKTLPFVPDVKANLSDHAVDMALKGLFYYLGKEEAAIRQNPAKRTTELLAKVFGG